MSSERSDRTESKGGSVEEARTESALEASKSPLPVEEEDEPPVVARLVVEIRSDGTRTVARGAMEDLESGQRVAIQARGASPSQLAMSLAKSLMERPLFSSALSRTGAVRRAVSAMLPRLKPGKPDTDD